MPVCTVFFLPGLGLDATAAAPLGEALDDRFRLVPIEFAVPAGEPDAVDGSVDALTRTALAAIAREADGGPWILLAHSMGGKIAAAIAAHVLAGRTGPDGESGLFGLAGSVLLAPSPPSPEPMSENRRVRMIGWVADESTLDEEQAQEFLSGNIASSLSDADSASALQQLSRFPPSLWRGWLEVGSREDISHEVGTLDLPVTVLAGDDDDDLGSTAQPALLKDVYPRAHFVPLPSTGHLIAYERPNEVAKAIVELWDTVIEPAPQTPAEWGRLIASSRTDVEVRSNFAERAVPDDATYAPLALTEDQLATLRRLADLLVPQPGTARIDLAARVDARLAGKPGDGWRPAGLPDDRVAYRLGLDALAQTWPDSPADQRVLVGRLVAGEEAVAAFPTAELSRRWFEDVRVDLVQSWMAHPASQARIGYDGFATGGTAPEPVGFSELAAGRRESWEPRELGRLGDRHENHDQEQHERDDA
ncbi:alpha/beta hydrolase [Naasia lichenicola]|nr:alpha/beta hydrolase [Naasia lichenicola]